MDFPDVSKMLGDAAIVAANEPRSASGYIGASSLRPRQKACLKMYQFAVLRTPRDPSKADLGLAVRLLRGTAMHDAVTRASRYADGKFEPAVTGRNWDLRIAGEADFLVRHGPDNELVVVELKTIDPDLFAFTNKPQDAHIYQVHAYMMLLGAKKAVVLYVPHNDEEGRDPITLLRQAMRRSAGKLRDAIETVINEYPLEEKRPPTKALGKSFNIIYDDVVADDIKGMSRDVLAAVDRKEWLGTNRDRCGLCPYTEPCWKQESMDACDRRQE